MIRIILFLIILIITIQCGFKPIDTTFSPMNIKGVEMEGYNKVNFFIKNDLLNKMRNSTQSDPVNIKITTDRKKEISEKNIRNEITKYRIILETKIEINKVNQGKLSEFDISTRGDYRVETSSINTAKNLNNLERKLSDEISNKIKQKLFFLNNDL